jgi:ribose transport system ATP-binding protein
VEKECFFKAIGITKYFPGVKALDNVSFELYPGEIFAIAGENGAGKSTFINIMSGVHQPDSGTLEMDGKRISFSCPRDAFDSGICVVHQELSYVSELTIAENIMMAQHPRTTKGIVDWKKMYTDAEEALEKIGLEIDTHKLLKECSTAQKQQIEIAKAIYWKARIIILDEPTSALNNLEVENLHKYLKKVVQQGTAVIYITHKLDEIFKIADRVAVLRDGKHIVTKETGNITKEELISYMVGRKLENMYPKQNTNIGEVILEVNNLSNDYCRNISFTLRKGEILGVYGLMGAGHIELGQMLFGDKPPKDGSIYTNGKEVRIRSPMDAIKCKMAYIPSERKIEGLILHHTVKQNIVSVHYQAMESTLINYKYEDEVTKKWVDAFRIKTPSNNTLVNSLSGGNQQKVVVAKWLNVDPEILIMIDPTRGIDVGSKAEIYHLMDTFCAKGLGIIMITSEMAELLAMSDRTIVMCDGKINGEFKREEFLQENIIKAAIGG